MKAVRCIILLLFTLELLLPSEEENPGYVVKVWGKNGKPTKFFADVDRNKNRKIKKTIESGSDYSDDEGTEDNEIKKTKKKKNGKLNRRKEDTKDEDLRMTILKNIAKPLASNQDYNMDNPTLNPTFLKLTGTMIVTQLLSAQIKSETSNNDQKKKINICNSKSLDNWLKKRGITNENEECTIYLNEIIGKDGKIVSWDFYDKKIKSLNLQEFKKGKMPHTQDFKFKKAVLAVVEFLKTRSTYNEYYSVLSFLKYHPDVNEILLNYAVIGANLERDDISHIIIDPLKDIILQSYLRKRPNTSRDNSGSDYARTGPLHLDDERSFSVDPDRTTTHDNERSWDYFREDPMFHVFHSLLHKVFEHTFPRDRANERFYYTHGQLIIRGRIERKLAGLPELVDLGVDEMEESLGPGYGIGYWGWEDMVGRPDQCRIDREDLRSQRRRVEELRRNRYSSLEELGRDMTANGYHAGGHLGVGNCDRSSLPAVGPMTFAECSARDPTFWRWHQHVDGLYRELSEKIMPRYTEQDFALSGGIAVKEIFTTSDNLPDNNLVTFLEDVRIQMAERSSLRYRRLNHQDFKFHVKLSNPRLEKRKVIVRIFLGLKKEGGDPGIWRNHETELIEMDRFVVTLVGETQEEIIRHSRESVSTMKNENGMTINRMAQMIEDMVKSGRSDVTDSFCGLPHHMYLPKSSVGGTEFQLLALVNDVNQDANEGSDGVEHMYCGHKDSSVVNDKRINGFPFDRKTNFDPQTIPEDRTPFKEATVKISHLGLIDKTALKEAIEQKNFVGDSNKNDIDENEEKNLNNTSSISNHESSEEDSNEDSNKKDIDSMSNQEIHNLLQEEVKKIKENKTTQKLPKKERRENEEKETNSKDKESVKIKEKNKPGSYQKEIKYESKKPKPYEMNLKKYKETKSNEEEENNKSDANKAPDTYVEDWGSAKDRFAYAFSYGKRN